ncbi:MAG: proteobacterial dedicated sortase system response regulator [Cellvibrionaceae bacterium]
MPKHIVIVEDEKLLADNYKEALQRQGFQVTHYSNRPDALAGLQNQLPDMAIIDVGLQDDIEGGFELCRELRSQSLELPIIFLTARDSEFDVISGLRLGADDYLTKDISQAHMMARIVALFRRTDALKQPEKQESLINSEHLTLNLDRMTVQWKEELIDLTVTEFWITHSLAKNPGHVKNRQQLMDAANVVLDDNTITSHVKRIRKKFIAVDSDFNAIQTAYGMGYRWVLEKQ